MDNLIDDLAPMEGASSGATRAPSPELIEGFGSNPGNLRMVLHTPSSRKSRRPLVVALHGCTQTAQGYATGSGWARLAEEHDFLLLLPEQTRANNHQTCFNWFEPGDTRRGQGEVESIRQMIATAIADHGAEPERIYITGLSAGGAMTAAMLAIYPDLFAGGAIIAGLPYGTASSVSEAFESMYSGRLKEPRLWGDCVRTASSHTGPWPSVSIWHGTADGVVKPINGGELVKQWTNVHGIGAVQPAEDHIGAISRRIWRDASKRARVTEYSIPGMGHGVPIAAASPPAPFFLPAGIDSSETICREWGLIQEARPKSLLSLLGLTV